MVQDLRCRLDIRHQWHVEHTEDGGLYKRCLRCGRDGADGDGANNGWALRKWW